ncbi:MAG: family 43 glycosylhydrolase [Clostridia bacterium]|nr:family 43 glycosylhydrolase [Clostridia bacterium]
MKRTITVQKGIKAAAALALCAAFMIPACSGSALALETTDTGVRVRDPFVLEYEGTYYMYGTGLAPNGNGYGCVTGTDLKNWSEPVKVCEPAGSCDGEGDWWAPECHYYKDAFYLFATYRSAATGKRGVAIFRAADPLGPFEIITDGHVTPKERDAIDGTLYVDQDGQPWMIYVGEWTSNEDGIGDMMAAKLSDDLTAFISEPIRLFRATDGRRSSGTITDGPFLYRTKNGRLLMLWSNIDPNGYCVRIAYSSNGRIDGRWRQQPGALYQQTKRHADGGHGMLFTAPDGTLTLAIHSPNFGDEQTPTTAVFVPVADIGATLIEQDENHFFTRLFLRFYYALMKLAT